MDGVNFIMVSDSNGKMRNWIPCRTAEAVVEHISKLFPDAVRVYDHARKDEPDAVVYRNAETGIWYENFTREFYEDRLDN